jgi:hypothetical protein
MDEAGTCAECILAHQKAAEAIRRDLAKSKKGGKK